MITPIRARAYLHTLDLLPRSPYLEALGNLYQALMCFYIFHRDIPMPDEMRLLLDKMQHALHSSEDHGFQLYTFVRDVEKTFIGSDPSVSAALTQANMVLRGRAA